MIPVSKNYSAFVFYFEKSLWCFPLITVTWLIFLLWYWFNFSEICVCQTSAVLPFCVIFNSLCCKWIAEKRINCIFILFYLKSPSETRTWAWSSKCMNHNSVRLLDAIFRWTKFCKYRSLLVFGSLSSVLLLWVDVSEPLFGCFMWVDENQCWEGMGLRVWKKMWFRMC